MTPLQPQDTSDNKGVARVPQIFYRRCRICGMEVEVLHGPEFHSESGYLLAEHLRGHSNLEVAKYVFAAHGIREFFSDD